MVFQVKIWYVYLEKKLKVIELSNEYSNSFISFFICNYDYYKACKLKLVNWVIRNVLWYRIFELKLFN